MRPRIAPLLLAFVLVGCTGADEPESPPPASPSPVTTPEPAAPEAVEPEPEPPAPPAREPFPPGLYFRAPHDGGRLASPTATLPRILLGGGGFALAGPVLAVGDGDALRLVDPEGHERRLVLAGLSEVGRVALAPDASRVAIEAREHGEALDVFVVDLATGARVRVSSGEGEDVAPAWSREGDLLAYSARGEGDGSHLHLVRPTGEVVLIVPDSGTEDAAVGSGRILDATRLLLRNATDGRVVGNLREAVLQGILAAGYVPTERFPLGGDFSPDGGSVVLEGEAERDSKLHLLVMTIGIDGAGFEIVAGPIPSDGSSLQPAWI